MKGICFTEPLFHKIVKGEKTQTRRIMNPQPTLKADWFIKELEGWKGFAVLEKYTDCELERFEIHKLLTPRYKVGEVIYLKEPYIYEYDKEEKCFRNYYKYLIADVLKIKAIGAEVRWKNKLFMPESEARYFIEITGVRVERLQDISNEDCVREGIIPCFSLTGGHWHYFMPDKLNEPYHSPVNAYAVLINRIDSKGTWDRNPYVWVYEFKLY